MDLINSLAAGIVGWIILAFIIGIGYGTAYTIRELIDDIDVEAGSLTEAWMGFAKIFWTAVVVILLAAVTIGLGSLMRTVSP